MPKTKVSGKLLRRHGAPLSLPATTSSSITSATPEQRFIDLLFDQHRCIDLPQGTYIKTENATRAHFHLPPLKISARPQDKNYELGGIFITFIKETLWTAVCIDSDKIISDLFEMRALLFIDQLKAVYQAIEHRDMMPAFCAELKENIIRILKDSFDREAITKNFMLFNLAGAKLAGVSIVSMDAHIAGDKVAFHQIMALIEVKDICHVIYLLHERGHITADHYHVMMQDLGQVSFNVVYTTFKNLYPTEEPLVLNRAQKLAIHTKYDALWTDFRHRYRHETQVKWLEDLKSQYKTLIGLLIVAVSLAIYAPMLWVGLSVLIVVTVAIGHKQFDRVISTKAQHALASEYQALKSRDEKKRMVGQTSILPDAVRQYEGPAWRKGLLYHEMLQAEYRWVPIDAPPVDTSSSSARHFPEVRLMSHAEYLLKLAELPKAPTISHGKRPKSQSPTTMATSRFTPALALTASASSSGPQRPAPTLSGWQKQGVFCYDSHSQSMAFFKFSERMSFGDRQTIQQHCVDGYGDFIAKRGEFDGFKWQDGVYKFKPSDSQTRIHFLRSQETIKVKTNSDLRDVPVWHYQQTVAKHR